MDYLFVLVIYILLPLALFTCLFYWYHTKNFNYWKDRGVPFIKPHWLFGSFKDTVLKSRSWPDYCIDLYYTYKENGYVGTYTFRRPSIFILDPQLIDKVLLQDFVCFEDRAVPHNPSEPLFDSPFYVRGDRWRGLRQQLLPAFTSRKVKDMFNQVFQSGEYLLNGIEKLARYEDGIDVEQAVFVYASDVIASCTFGIQLQTDSQLWNQFLRAVTLSTTTSPWQTTKYLLSMMYPELFQWFGVYLNDKFVTDFFTNVTKSTVKYREENKVERNDFLQSILVMKHKEEQEYNYCCKLYQNHCFNSAINLTKDRRIFQSIYDLLYSNSKTLRKLNTKGKIFSNNCIASFMFSFVITGVSLEVGTTSFALFELARNPLIQNKLREEVDLCISKHGSLSYEAIKDMTYLDQVLQETLRMYTLFPVLTRDVTAPYILPGTDVVLEEGMFVLIPAAAIHKDPRYYPSPESFNPDRFIDNNYRPSSIFLPFGHGPRMCLAIKFAVLIMKVCISTIVSKYLVTFGNKMKLPLRLNKSRLFVRSEDGIWLSFSPRS